MELMDYYLTGYFYSPEQTIRLSEEEYQTLHSAKRNLLTALGIEEKLEIVLENYLEFESDLNDLALRSSMFSKPASSRFPDIHRINRRIMNVLSACKTYLDQLHHEISTIYGKESTQFNFVNSLCKREYDSHLGYRTLEALRNYTQHRDLPVDAIQYSSSANGEGPQRLIKTSCTVHTMLTSLAEDAEFKPTVLKELQQFGDKVDLKPMIREYITCIWRIHSEVRGYIAGDVGQWDAHVESAIERFRKKFPQETAIAVAKVEDNNPTECVYLSNDFSKRRKELQSKNHHIGDLRKRYITSQCEE